MTTTAGSRIVVGVDGSAEAEAALTVAIAEAASRRLPLHIVHAVPIVAAASGAGGMGVMTVGSAYEAGEEYGETLLGDARAKAAEAGVSATVALSATSATSALLFAAADPEHTTPLLVVGSRGRGGLARMLLGSVSSQLAAHAPCPVMIVHSKPATDDPGRVVVGVDGSPTSATALGFAFDEASRHGDSVTVLHAWDDPAFESPERMMPLVFDWSEVKAEHERELAETLAGFRERYPDVTVETRVVRARPAEALVTAAEGARMVVVGHRGRGGFPRLTFGGTAHAVALHASTIVTVVRTAT